MLKNRFFKNTLGFFAEIAIATGLDESNVGAAQANIEDFVTSGVAGTLSAFWADTGLVVATGATALAANAKRSFYYAWKQADGTVRTTTPIATAGLKYQSVAYNAGTAQVRTATYTGTYSLGQIVHVKVIETTGTVLPFPTFGYSAVVGAGGIDAALVAIAADINAETDANNPVATAVAAAGLLTVTAVDKVRNFKITSFVEVTSAYPTDQSTIVLAETVKQVHPIGDLVTIKELEKHFITNNGGVIYTPNTYTAEEFASISSNVDTTGATQYGFVLVTSDRVERGGVVNQALAHRAQVIIALPTADVAALAAL